MISYEASALRISSSICSNISSAYMGILFVTPIFIDLTTVRAIALLIQDIVFAILFYIAGVFLDNKAYEI